eukprot:5253770-Amphidinium_carterae.1
MGATTWLWTYVQAPLEDPHSIALRAIVWAAARCPWLNACLQKLGLSETLGCTSLSGQAVSNVLEPPWWRSGQMLTSRTSGGTGDRADNHNVSLENRLNTCSLERSQVCLGYRQQGWIPPTSRIGEAKKPGPTICSANPGGWSRIDGTLNLKHDIVAVQETFVLREQVSSAKYTADKLKYYSSFTPARKTDGRPSGGLALLCRQAQPLQRMEKGAHWDQGHWAHHLLPFEGGLHIFN